jgi:hypothetical protein
VLSSIVLHKAWAEGSAASTDGHATARTTVAEQAGS